MNAQLSLLCWGYMDHTLLKSTSRESSISECHSSRVEAPSSFSGCAVGGAWVIGVWEQSTCSFSPVSTLAPMVDFTRVDELEGGQELCVNMEWVDLSIGFFWLGSFFSGVWKGLVARIIMIGTLTALQWFIYDSVKVYFRLPRPPPPEMPESLKKKLGLTE